MAATPVAPQLKKSTAATDPKTQAVAAPPAPVVIVKQLQAVKPYNGTTPWKTFRDHFIRVARANGWQTDTDKVQNLALALDGPALEVLKEIDDQPPLHSMTSGRPLNVGLATLMAHVTLCGSLIIAAKLN